MGNNITSGPTRCTAIQVAGRAGLRVAIAILIALSSAVGCATPEERYRTLSIFFDDVPLPASMTPPPPVEDLAAPDPTESVASRLPTIDWVVHKPDCAECHISKRDPQPHTQPPQLCWSCHRKDEFVKEMLHGPFAAGACLQCHTPHKSQFAALLNAAPADLCGTCHDATTFPSLEEHREKEGENCVACHNPHSASRRYMLREGAAAVHAPLPGSLPGAPP